MADQFGHEPLPAPSDEPVPFALDEYVFGLNPKQRDLFLEPHRPDPYRDVPILEKGVEFTEPDKL